MQRKIRLLAIGLAFCTASVLVHGKRANPSATPATVANLLDQLVQPRFLQDAGKFGMERIEIAGHEDQSADGEETIYQLKARTNVEKQQLRQANAANHDYAIGFIHCPHKPGKFLPRSKTNSGDTSESDSEPGHFITLVVHKSHTNLYDRESGADAEDWERNNYARVDRAVRKVLPQVRRGQSVNVRIGGLFLALRPVKANQASCLDCHRGVKPNETLGIMAYAVSTKTRSQ